MKLAYEVSSLLRTISIHLFVRSSSRWHLATNKKPLLLRITFLLAGFMNASMFCRGKIRFLSLDSISFSRPVPIGSILKLESMILHMSSSDGYPVLVVSVSNQVVGRGIDWLLTD
jgi:hypothetical protein